VFTAAIPPMMDGGLSTINLDTTNPLQKVKAWHRDRLPGWIRDEAETDVVRLEKKSIPASEFQPPEGYKKVTFAQAFGGM
jgi:hypothetical protein